MQLDRPIHCWSFSWQDSCVPFANLSLHSHTANIQFVSRFTWWIVPWYIVKCTPNTHHRLLHTAHSSTIHCTVYSTETLQQSADPPVNLDELLEEHHPPGTVALAVQGRGPGGEAHHVGNNHLRSGCLPAQCRVSADQYDAGHPGLGRQPHLEGELAAVVVHACKILTTTL